jgi:uncharacterized protein YcnI
MRTILTAVAGSMLLASTSAGFAHVTVRATTTNADARAIITYQVPAEDCMTTLRIQIPQGVTGVSPMPKPGWNLEVVEGAYATPVIRGDNEITEGVLELVYTGGHLPVGWYDEFPVRVRLPQGEPGTLVYFPAIQECADDGSTRAWVMIPVEGQEEPEFPASKLTLTAE